MRAVVYKKSRGIILHGLMYSVGLQARGMSSKTTVEVTLVDILDKMENRLQANQLALENRLQANQVSIKADFQSTLSYFLYKVLFVGFGAGFASFAFFEGMSKMLGYEFVKKP